MQKQEQTASDGACFTLSTQLLQYSICNQAQKVTVKNTSLKTTSYQIILLDQEHFKLAGTYRSFSLAPGISKQITIKHIEGEHCSNQQRQNVKGKIRDFNGRWIGFQCVCPRYKVYKEPEIIQYPKQIKLGEFDQKTNFEIQIKNVSDSNLKILLEEKSQFTPGTSSQGSILMTNSNKKLTVKSLNRDSIILSNQTLKLQFELNVAEHGQLKSQLNFSIIVEQTTSKFFKNRKASKLQTEIQPIPYSITLTGFSVSKKLILKDENQAIVNEIRNEVLTGTTKSSFFYIETQYHQDMHYVLQAYFQTENPSKYAQKWRNISIVFNQGQSNRGNNTCEGILKTENLNKIEYTIHTNYTTDDENYVSKYSKIQFEDDSNALRMRNSQYSKKYEDLQVQIIARVQPESNLLKNINRTGHEQKDFITTIPFKFTIINPSLRCQVTQIDQTANITIFNETKMSIPLNFPMHSLYRIIKKGCESQSLQSVIGANKKQSITINWVKPNQRCCIYMEIPSFDIVLYQTRGHDLREKNIISLPPSRRRPMTSISSAINAKQKQPCRFTICKESQHTSNFFDFTNRPSSQLHSRINPFNSFKNARNSSATKSSFKIGCDSSHKKVSFTKDLPPWNKNKQQIPEIEELRYLVQFDNIIKNTHPQKKFVVDVIGVGYLILHPNQFYIFDNISQLSGYYKDSLSWGATTQINIKYKVYGHAPIYQISLPYTGIQNIEPVTQNSETTRRNISTIHKTKMSQITNLYEPPLYQIISKQIRMSFKQSKQEFQIIEPILIKNLTNHVMEVNCISIDSEFFKSKEPNRLLAIQPNQIGQFKIGFQPENTVRLSVLHRKPPKQVRRKAIVKSDDSINLTQNSAIISKEIKLLINKQVQTINCIGEIIEKSCSVKPYQINLTNCKYGSPEVVETMIITNTSLHKINFIIENPAEISIRPKTGSIAPKCTQNCIITFKPCKKISNLQQNIRILIGGSHLQLVPLFINVEDPEIYIKQTELVPLENAICGTQLQELNLEMTLINSNPSQSFIEINLKDTPLSLGFTKNYHSPNSGLVAQNFNRCSQISQQPTQSAETVKHSAKRIGNSVKSILTDSNQSYFETQNKTHIVETEAKPKVCSLTVGANSFLIVPLTLRISNAKIGINTIQIQKNIASLVGFGQIKSPHLIKFNCNKTLLHINPYKQFQEIILTQNQKNYQISLKNMSDSTLKVKTQIRQLPKSQSSAQILGKQNGESVEPSIICTFKDIQQDIKPEASLDLTMNFICFEEEKKLIKGSYQLTIFVKECHLKNDMNEDYIAYFTTVIDVIVPEPFLQISPNVLVMPTVATNTWSRQSFYVKNNGFKEIFIKILKPTNIAFQFDCQIVSPEAKSKLSNDKKESARASKISIYSEQRNSHKKQPKILQNQLTKIHNTIEIRVSFRSKSTISFKCMLQIEDNFKNKYELVIVGTCTDSPFFAFDTPISQFVSNPNFPTHRSFTSDKSLISTKAMNPNLCSNNLESTDIEDLLFLNNWIGSLISQISNQSTFFYVWLTKIDNFVKFLAQFNVYLRGYSQLKTRIKTEKREENTTPIPKYNLTSAFEELKQQGFQLNSLRIQLLEKADQLQWLSFMWFFLSKTILSPSFLTWLSKHTTSRDVQEINYGYVQKNFQQILTILMSTLLSIKKENNNNNPVDWKYLVQNFEPLLQNFKQVQSRRHLILSLNIIYHKLSNIEHQIIQISDFQFLLTVQNIRSRKVRYFLQCNTKLVTCEQSSNKVLPSQTPHGYSFVVEQGEEINVTMSLKNYTVSALSVITKSVIDLMDIIMFNNIIWDPITIFHIRLKRKDDIIHHVDIECENKSTQQWVYRFQAKMSAEYRIFFQPGQGNEFMKLVSGQPGFLKKGQSTTIRVLYSPENMNKCEATLRIANTMVKEVFLIHGKPLHSSKLQFEKCLKIVQNEEHQQVITVPWQNIMSNPTQPREVSKTKNAPTSAKMVTSSTSRQQNGIINHIKQSSNQIPYILKLFNPNNLAHESTKHMQCITKKAFNYNPIKKQLAINLVFKYQQLIRNLQLLFQVSNGDKTQSKLVRLVIDVIPKPILIQGEIQCEYNSHVTENVKLPNLAKICESVSIEYGYLPPDTCLTKIGNAINGSANSGLHSAHKGLFDLVKIRNNDVLSFGNINSPKIPDSLDLPLKYFPNENNCYYNQQTLISDPKIPAKTQRTGLCKKKVPSTSNLPVLPSSDNINQNQTYRPNTQLPYFYITAYYQQSLYKLTYIFKPSIKKSNNKIQSILSQQKKDIYHECLPLVKYYNNVIYIENQTNQTVIYDVETDLYEILGKNQIMIKPMSVGKYSYEICCMHLGTRQGTIKFRKAKQESNYISQFNVTLNISDSAPPPDPLDTARVNGCMPKGSCLQDGLRIYNQYFQITSTVRRPKIFSIFLVNLSEKEIEYEVCCDCQYLHPNLPVNQNNKKVIKISKKTEYELEIGYLPYFVGSRQAKISLYNPYQPEITYRICMISQESIECISKDMHKIGENKPFELVIPNPSIMPKYKHLQVIQQKQLTIQLELISLSLNGKIIPITQYSNYLKLYDQNHNEPIQAHQLFTVKLQYSPNKKSNHSKFYIVFHSYKLLTEYNYELNFMNVNYGEYKYKINYKYPQIQRIQPMVILVDQSNGQSELKICQGHVELKLSIPFANRFSQDLQLCVKSLNSDDYVKIQPTSCNRPKSPKDTIKIGSYLRELIPIIVCSKTRRSELELQINSTQLSMYTWLYPVVIYQVYEYDPSKRPPIMIKGQARQPIFAKIYPLIAFNCSSVDIVVDDKFCKEGEEPKMRVQLKEDIIRKKAIKNNISTPMEDRSLENSPNQQKANNIGESLVNLDTAQRPHTHLSPQFLYEVEVQVNTACAMKAEGYFYVYQTNLKIQSKNMTPAVSEKNLFKTKQLPQTNSELGNYFIEKIPFIMKIGPPKVDILEFEADVGEKSTIKIMIETLKSEYSHKKLPNSLLDHPVNQSKGQVKIELHNNKCRQFSAVYIEKQNCIEVTYFAQQYSSLKKGKLQVMIEGIYSQYELIGKFRKKDIRRMSKPYILPQK